MDALRLMKFQLGIIDDYNQQLDEFYQFYLDAAAEQIKKENGKTIDMNNPHELSTLVALAVEMTKIDRNKEPEFLKISRTSMMLDE